MGKLVWESYPFITVKTLTLIEKLSLTNIANLIFYLIHIIKVEKFKSVLRRVAMKKNQSTVYRTAMLVHSLESS